MTWLVEHRDGFCATKSGKRAPESAASVETLCGHFVILPYSTENGKVDCPECLKAMQARPSQRGGKEE